jgi:hypothetical protein
VVPGFLFCRKSQPEITLPVSFEITPALMRNEYPSSLTNPHEIPSVFAYHQPFTCLPRDDGWCRSGLSKNTAGVFRLPEQEQTLKRGTATKRKEL